MFIDQVRMMIGPIAPFGSQRPSVSLSPPLEGGRDAVGAPPAPMERLSEAMMAPPSDLPAILGFEPGDLQTLAERIHALPLGMLLAGLLALVLPPILRRDRDALVFGAIAGALGLVLVAAKASLGSMAVFGVVVAAFMALRRGGVRRSRSLDRVEAHVGALASRNEAFLDALDRRSRALALASDPRGLARRAVGDPRDRSQGAPVGPHPSTTRLTPVETPPRSVPPTNTPDAQPSPTGASRPAIQHTTNR